MNKTILIEGMTCEGCSGRIERLLNQMDGVEATVDLESKKATISAPDSVSEKELVDTIENAGFTVADVS